MICIAIIIIIIINLTHNRKLHVRTAYVIKWMEIDIY